MEASSSANLMCCNSFRDWRRCSSISPAVRAIFAVYYTHQTLGRVSLATLSTGQHKCQAPDRDSGRNGMARLLRYTNRMMTSNRHVCPERFYKVAAEWKLVALL